ncbi:MAG TPA: flagellar hook-associated protein FlgK [Caulobacteraceae bacterium]|nr:flagellar hook-associated protein FlgK [Caulobacteraceae bacterium]
MTTLNSILQTSSAGLSVAQLGIGTVSNNVANLNTPGYVREVVDQNTVTSQGVGAGVSASSITRVANQYLQNASLAASGAAGLASAVASTLSQAQSLFGDPTSTASYFNQLNTVFADFSAAANNPTSSLSSGQAVSDIQQFLSQSQSISSSLTSLSNQADAGISNDVDQANQLLGQISQLNAQITTTTASQGQAADLQNTQGQLINQLSSLIGVKVTATASGGVNVSTTGGAQLVGQFGAATLSYTSSATSTGQVSIIQPGAKQAQALSVTSGDMGGLLGLRNIQVPGLQSQLSEFVSQTVNAINQASNAATSVPPPAQLTGQNIGLDLPSAIGNFTGQTTIAVVNSSGQLQHSIAVDFSADTISVDGGAASSFTPSTFLSSLNTALGSAGTASFNNGVLTLNASVAGTGIAIQDSSTTPSNNAGRGFSQYFGLNNLITSSQITNYNTGLTASDPSGFTPGGTITLGVNDGSGNPITNVTVAMPPAGSTVQDVINSLNSSATGVGLFGKFNLSSTGALTFTPATPGGASLTVVADSTQTGAGGPSLSQLFGIGDNQRASRTNSYSVRSDIAANPGSIMTATLNLGAAAGQPVLVSGDGSGLQRLANAGASMQSFDAAGGSPAETTTVTNYAAQFAGGLANNSSAAATASTNATAVQNEAESQRQSVEGVNLDQELVNLTTYQQAYTASARLVTATQDMFSTLLTMVGQ